MNRSRLVTRLATFVSLSSAVVSCGPDAPTTPPTPSAAVVSMPVGAQAKAGGVTIAAPASTHLHPGDKLQLTATVILPNGKAKDKFPIKWSTSNSAVATVDEKTGEVTAVASGAVTITAKAGPRTGQIALTVVVPVARVTLSPDAPYLTWNSRVATTTTLTVAAFDASGAPISDLAGRSIVWASDDTTTATVAATDKPGQGLVTDVRVGKATISATVDGVRGTAQLTVEPQSGFIAGTTNSAGGIPPLSVGESVPLRMYFVDANDIVVPIDDTQLGPKSWVSVNPAVATVSATGVATGVALGDTEIRGTYRGFTVRDPIFVVSVASIEVIVTPSTLRVGQTASTQVVLRDAQGSVIINGPPITYRTSPDGAASVTSFGLVTGLKPGVTRVIASAEGRDGSAEITVIPAAPPPNAPSPGGFSYGYDAPFAYIITVGWRDNSDNETAFQIERAVGGTNDFVLQATVPGSDSDVGSSADADNITELTLYTYRVRACNAAGCSAYSTPQSTPGPLRQPTNLVAIRDGTGVRLTWEDNTAKEEGYRVDVALVGASGPATIEATYNLPPNTTEFIAPGGAPGTKVFYQVTAFANVPGFGYFGSPFGLVSPYFTF